MPPQVHLGISLLSNIYFASYFLLHLIQWLVRILPCISITFLLPDNLCNPSIFWVIIAFNLFLDSKVVKYLWIILGFLSKTLKLDL